MRLKKVFWICLVAMLSASILFSCKDTNDVISTDSSLRLSFSSDTVRFDTVFSTIKSETKRILIHNYNKNAINIASIQLMGDSSYFRINADGYSGNQQDVEIRGQDSLYLFVELTVNQQNRDNPIFIEDSIRFISNGNTQYLRLEAYGQDVYIWENKTISKDTTITSKRPFLVYDTLRVARGAQLTMESGTQLYFHKGAGLYVDGQVTMSGTIDKPILLRGDRTDKLLTDVSYDNGVSGQWDGVYVDSLSFENIFTNVRIRNSNYGINFKRSLPDEKKATLTNVVIHNLMADGLTATNCLIDFYNCLISNAKSMCVRLIGGQYTFLHCTLANYFNAVDESRSSGSRTLYIGNILNGKVVPLLQCDLTNCIISGSSSTEIQLSNTLNGNSQTPFNHLFTNCLINMKGTDDENFVSTIWNKDPEFINLNTNKDYVFSFELDSTSTAINAANRSYSSQLPLDLKGVSRLNDSNPDIGCYEWKQK